MRHLSIFIRGSYRGGIIEVLLIWIYWCLDYNSADDLSNSNKEYFFIISYFHFLPVVNLYNGKGSGHSWKLTGQKSKLGKFSTVRFHPKKWYFKSGSRGAERCIRIWNVQAGVTSCFYFIILKIHLFKNIK